MGVLTGLDVRRIRQGEIDLPSEAMQADHPRQVVAFNDDVASVLLRVATLYSEIVRLTRGRTRRARHRQG